MGNALGRRLIDEKLARIRRGIRVVSDDLDPFGPGSAQRGRNTLFVFASSGDDIHAQGNPVVDNLVLPRRIRVGWSIEDQVHAKVLSRFVGPFFARNEISIALALRHERDN